MVKVPLILTIIFFFFFFDVSFRYTRADRQQHVVPLELSRDAPTDNGRLSGVGANDAKPKHHEPALVKEGIFVSCTSSLPSPSDSNSNSNALVLAAPHRLLEFMRVGMSPTQLYAIEGYYLSVLESAITFVKSGGISKGLEM